MTDQTTPQTTALDLDRLIACHGCDLLMENQPPAPGEKLCCPRCGEVVRTNKIDSINRTLAFSFSGLILYPFAMFEPIMTLDTMGLKNAGNIFDCMIDTWRSGYSFVAVIVGLTSIFFPLVKLLLLFLVSLQLKQGRSTPTLARLMRAYVHLDEWGMLEVLMIGLLVTIIKISHLAHISYDIGFFCFVGLLVMALGSSITMDKEEFWNRIENGKE